MSELAASMASQQGEKILTEMRALISKEFAELRSNVIERPLDTKEMSAFLGIHENTLYRWVSEGIIPPAVVHRMHGTNYFFPSEIVKHIKQL